MRTSGSLRSAALAPVLFYFGLVLAIVSSLGAQLIPTIARVDHVSLRTAQWSLTVTLIVGAGLSPTVGRLGDGPHRRRILLAGLATVVAGTTLSALSHGIVLLLVGRALQGVGLGVMPIAIAVARDHLRPDRARATISMLSIATVAGVGLGYPVTGLVTGAFGLSGAFWFGSVMSAIALVAAAAVIPHAPQARHRPLDVFGSITLTVALTGMLLVISEGRAWGWSSNRVGSVLVASVTLLAIWVAHELRTTDPLVELRLLRARPVAVANIMALLLGIVGYLLFSALTRYVQTPPAVGYGFGASVALAGLVFTPFSAGTLIAGRTANRLARAIGETKVIVGGIALSALSVTLYATSRTSLWVGFVTTGVQGLGIGTIFSIAPALIVRNVPATETSSAMAVNQVLRQIGASIGSAAAAAILAAYTPAGRLLPTDSGYTATLRVALVLCVGVGVLVAALSRGRLSSPSPTDEAEVTRLGHESADAAAAGVLIYEDPGGPGG